jgi:predicted enzyme related to lactoylglutathione lyase
MLARDGYPAGVPCWIDVVQADPERTMAFYGDLFGWTYEIRTPADAPTRYAYALLDGLTVGGVGGPPASEADGRGWTMYVSVTSADEAVAAVAANGGRVLAPPTDIPRSGRVAVCTDPWGARFGVWQAAELRGSQLVNAPGAWNFSELNTPDPDGAERFYGAVFGWVAERLEMDAQQPTGMWRVEGYGEFLAERDPAIRERQAADQAPGGFADAVALLGSLGATPGVDAEWGVMFAVDDADAAFERATKLGAVVITPLFDTQYTRMGTVEDPQGAVITLSEYRPPSPD